MIPTEMRPLLLVEGVSSASPEGTFVEWGVRDSQQPGSISPGPLTLYSSRSDIHIGKRNHPQHTYTWFYRVSNATGDTAPWMKQGLRMTFGEDGSPEIWEILRDSSGADLVFISTRLEALAASQFGPPLVGRLFSIEASLQTSPTTLVPRTIPDGPIPMGPWVYLDRTSQDVSTILCRCMPSQVTGEVDTAYYELEEETSDHKKSKQGTEAADAPAQIDLWEWKKREAWLEQQLRLPSDW